MNNTPDILSLLPQQPPFIMIDALHHSDENTTRTGFTVDTGNVLMQGGYFTEAGLMENIAQTAAAGAGYTALQQQVPVRNGYIAAVKNMEVFFLPQTGDRLVTEVKRGEQVFNMSVISAQVFCNDRIVAQCEMKIFLL